MRGYPAVVSAPAYAPARASANDLPGWVATLFGLVASSIFVLIEARLGFIRVRAFDVLLALFVGWMILVRFQGSRFPAVGARTSFTVYCLMVLYFGINALALSGLGVTVKIFIQSAEFLLFAYLLSVVLADDDMRWKFIVAFTAGLWFTALANTGLHVAAGAFIGFKAFGDMKQTYGFAAMLTFFLLLTRTTAGAFVRLLAMLIVILVLLVLSAERKSWVAFSVASFAAIGVSMFLRGGGLGTAQLRRALGRLAFIGPTLVVLVAVFVFSVPELSRRAITTIGAFMVFFDGDLGAVDDAYQSASNASRAFVADRALEQFEANPVFGMGIEQFRAMINNLIWDIPESYRVGAHSEYLTVAAEAGIVGLVFYCGLWLTNLVMSIRIAGRRSGDLPAFDRLAVVGFAVYSMIICAFLSSSATTWFFLTFPLGYTAALYRRSAMLRRSRPPAGATVPARPGLAAPRNGRP